MSPRPEDPAGHPAHRLFATALLHSVASGSVRPFVDAVEGARPRLGADAVGRIAAAELAVQRLGPLVAALPDVSLLTADLRELLRREAAEAAATARDLATLVQESAKALAREGCHAVVVGDAAAAFAAYRDPSLRTVPRLHLLVVRRGDLDRARQAISSWPRATLLSSIRYRAFGGAIDLTGPLLDDPVLRKGDGVPFLVASPAALASQLLLAAAAGFAGEGFPGVLAIDLRLLALASGPIPLAEGVTSGEDAASLLHAVDAIERFCPGTFAPAGVARLAAEVSPARRERARTIPPLLGTRPAAGRRLAATLVESPLGRLAFLLRRPGTLS